MDRPHWTAVDDQSIPYTLTETGEAATGARAVAALSDDQLVEEIDVARGEICCGDEVSAARAGCGCGGRAAAYLARLMAEIYERTVTDEIISAGVDRATYFYRNRRPGRGEFELVRTALRLAKRVGDGRTIEAFSDLVYLEAGRPPMLAVTP